MSRRTGIWLVGAWGGIGTTVAVGLAALQRGATHTTGLVTALPALQHLPLLEWSDMVIGGHDVRTITYAAEAAHLMRSARVFSPELLAHIAPVLAAWDKNIRPGTLHHVGERISSLADAPAREMTAELPAMTAERLQEDLLQFRREQQLDQVIVVNVASTEPPADDELRTLGWSDLALKLELEPKFPIPASTIYAIAAMRTGCHYVNFTPSVGSDLMAMDELARKHGVLHCGRDGKTGETLLKSVLAPMFAARNLHVLSWVGHNIFGNMDGKVLDDPVNKANKVKSKDHLLTEILGYKPQSLVSIEYIESMGDWKTAWDHIHFQGFLGTPMVLQFTWQGCDSLLAAPLVLDLVRLTDVAAQRNERGVMNQLACFFKSPMGADSPAFAEQFGALLAWAGVEK